MTLPLRAALFLSCLCTPALARIVTVSSTGALAGAIEHAEPGDDIVLADGEYAIARPILAATMGSAAAPVIVRAAHRWQAHLVSTAQVAITVGGAYWQFRGLDIRGACTDDTKCEHAFHVVGRATDVVIADNRIVDFNAQVKANADDAHVMPVRGLVQDNTLFDTHPRHTENPVVPLDLDNASAWVVRGNAIYDFAKDGGNQVAYGAFVKGGAVSPVLERNWVVCSRHVPATGSQVGLSLGGGGMDRQLCAPHWDSAIACDPEVEAGIIRNNIITNCNDDGIYLNQAHDTRVLFNALIRTQGIDFRFDGSSGVARGNLMSNIIHARDGASFTDGGNLTDLLSGEELDAWYQQADAGDLRLRHGVPKPVRGAGGTDAAVTDDFCGRARHGALDMGALQSSLGSCDTAAP